jgi:hypothetical protein
VSGTETSGEEQLLTGKPCGETGLLGYAMTGKPKLEENWVEKGAARDSVLGRGTTGQRPGSKSVWEWWKCTAG